MTRKKKNYTMHSVKTVKATSNSEIKKKNRTTTTTAKKKKKKEKENTNKMEKKQQQRRCNNRCAILSATKNDSTNCAKTPSERTDEHELDSCECVQCALCTPLRWRASGKNNIDERARLHPTQTAATVRSLEDSQSKLYALA